MRVAIQKLRVALEKNYFYITACVVGVLFGLGGLVHVGNILGFGGAKWSAMAIQFKIGDIVWGALDFLDVVGVVLRSPLGVLAILVAALSQIVMYGFFPDLFVLRVCARITW